MNKTLYAIVFCILIFAQIALGQNQSNKTDYPNLKKQATELNKATVGGDFNKVADYTYPMVVEKFGGREKMIAYLKNDSAQTKAAGIELDSASVGEIKQIEKIDNELFALVPITTKAKTPQGKVAIDSFIIGISTDNGTNWKFINGINQEKLKTIFPKAAEKIQIPADSPPKLVENE